MSIRSKETGLRKVGLAFALFALVSFLIIGLISSEGSSGLSLFAILLPYEVFGVMLWFFGMLILLRESIIGLYAAFFRGQRGAAGRRASLRQRILSYMLFLGAAIAFLYLYRQRVASSIFEYPGKPVETLVTDQGGVPAVAIFLKAAPAVIVAIVAYGIPIAFIGILAMLFVFMLLGLKKARDDLIEDFSTEQQAGKEMLQTVKAAVEELKAGEDYKHTIILCYKRMCDLLASAGAAPKETETPREFKGTATRILHLKRGALGDLTELFEEARYSEHPISDLRRGEAISCLRSIEEELGDRLAKN